MSEYPRRETLYLGQALRYRCSDNPIPKGAPTAAHSEDTTATGERTRQPSSSGEARSSLEIVQPFPAGSAPDRERRGDRGKREREENESPRRTAADEAEEESDREKERGSSSPAEERPRAGKERERREANKIRKLKGR